MTSRVSRIAIAAVVGPPANAVMSEAIEAATVFGFPGSSLSVTGVEVVSVWSPEVVASVGRRRRTVSVMSG